MSEPTPQAAAAPRTAYAGLAAVIRARKDGPEWQAAWEALCREYAPKIREVARAMHYDEDDALSDALLHLFVTLPHSTWDESRRFTPYLRSIVRNLIYSNVRKRVRGDVAVAAGGTDPLQALANHADHRRGPEPTSSGKQLIDPQGYGELLTALLSRVHGGMGAEYRFHLSHATRIEAIEAALDQVMPHNREVIYRMYTTGERGSVTEVARAVGRSPNAIEQVVRRFEARLEEELKSRGPDATPPRE